MSLWRDHVDRWKDCQDCPLSTQRGRICLARGTIPCDVLFIGEAPGASEDAIGQPFVGPAGQLLDRIIIAALAPEVTYALTNLVCCFPRDAKGRGDNEPEDKEIRACEPRLVEFVNIAQPRLIVCVGKLSTRWIDHRDTVQCIDIVHPAAVLRMPLIRKDQEVRRQIVTIRQSVNRVMTDDYAGFKQWENGGHVRRSKSQFDIQESDVPW